MTTTVTPEEVQELRRRAEDLLAERCRKDRLPFGLTVAADQTQDEWIYLVVVPNRADVRAGDYVDLLVEVEKDLRAATGVDSVLLVPALPG